MVETVPAPLIQEGHVLVEVVYSLISTGTEIHSLENSGKSLVIRALEQPDKVKQLLDHLRRQGIQKTVAKVWGQLSRGNPTGYSCSGIVIQVGRGVPGIQPGNQVACAGAGIANHAEIVLVPNNLVVKVPEGSDLKAAASVTPGAIALQGVRSLDTRLGEIIAVVGLGLLGQLTVQLLRAAGCWVIGFDMDARRVALARKLGANHAFVSHEVDVLNEVQLLTEGHGVDATIITASSQSDAIVQQAMEITRKKGRVVVVGDVGLGLKRSPFYEKEIAFLISCSYGPGRYDERYEKQGLDYPYAYVRWTENRNMAEYLRLVAGGKVQVMPILEREYDLAQATKAYEELRTASEKPLGILLCYLRNDQQTQAAKLATKVVLRSKPVSSKIKVAVLGAGAFAREIHLPNLQKLSDVYDIYGVVNKTGSNAKAIAEQYNASYATTDFKELLADENVDMVIIATRHNLHVQMAIESVKAGKAVFLEKPMALNKEELRELVHILEETKVPFMVGFNRRFSPYAQKIKEVIKNRLNPMIINYRMNVGYIPKEHWIHSEEGGGRNIGEACHIYDLFNFLTESEVESVSATSIDPKTEQYARNDNFVATIKYKDGSVCNLIYTALGTNEVTKEQMEIFGDGKIIRLNDYKKLEAFGTKVKGMETKLPQKGQYEELVEFARNLKEGDGYPIPLWQLIQATEISFEVEEMLCL